LTQIPEHRLLNLSEESASALLASINRGIEREALRVSKQGTLSVKSHPRFLGSKLCHPFITTDFSEAQLELITSVSQSLSNTLEALDEIHRYVYSGFDDEFLWSASMPCELSSSQEVPLAQYGKSNLARLKTTYRNGLGNRYGRSMQTICAVHYNFSLSEEFWKYHWNAEGTGEALKEFKSRRYFDQMRNFRRLSWLPIYLFGASPVVSNSFVRGKQHRLERFDDASLYAPFATSLRNGDLGYQSDTQASAIRICFNSLDDYVDTLVDAITTPHDEYSRIGLKRGDEYLQVNANILQAEAEFYSTIRAKCVPPPGKNFLKELKSKGVEYVEVRLLDVNPYLPLGIDESQIRFLDTMLLYCMLAESPVHDDRLCESVKENAHLAVYQGRDPGLLLDDIGEARSIESWGRSILEEMKPVARLLDSANGIKDHEASLHVQQAKIIDSSATPSARILADMKSSNQSFFEFAMSKNREHRSYFQSRPISESRLKWFDELAEESFMAQARLEQSDTVSFDEYLENMMRGYFELAQKVQTHGND
jgi:glutamate--cysteine ligase